MVVKCLKEKADALAGDKLRQPGFGHLEPRPQGSLDSRQLAEFASALDHAAGIAVRERNYHGSIRRAHRLYISGAVVQLPPQPPDSPLPFPPLAPSLRTLPAAPSL